MFSLFTSSKLVAAEQGELPRLLADTDLSGYDATTKQLAQEAIEVLKCYKDHIHDFTDEIIEFWALPQKIMDRYQLDDAEQLNEWLDNL